MKRKYSRPFVGLTVAGGREVFRAVKPTRETHPKFMACIGPFKTVAGAKVMAKSFGNPHIRCVAEAERAAVAMRHKV